MESPSLQTTLNMTSVGTSSFHMTRGAVLAAAIIEIIIIIVGTVGNLFTIIAVLRNRSLQYATNYLIVSLAVADFLVSTILVPMRVSQHVAYQNGVTIPKTFVEVAGFVGRVNIIASISTLVCLSVDRYVALTRPLRYFTSIRFNLKKVSIVIATVWILSVLITSLPKFPGVTDTPFLIFFVVFVLTATLIISIMYYQIFKIVAKSLRDKTSGQPVRYSNNFQSKCPGRENRVASQPDNPERPNACTSVGNNTSDIGRAARPSSMTTSRDALAASSSEVASSSIAEPPTSSPGANFSQERKAAKTVGLVIVAFVVLVYPRIIMILYHFACDETPSSRVARFWMRVLLYFNSAVNPLFYAYRHKGFRQEFKNMALRCVGAGRELRRRYATMRGTQQSQNSSSTFNYA